MFVNQKEQYSILGAILKSTLRSLKLNYNKEHDRQKVKTGCNSPVPVQFELYTKLHFLRPGIEKKISG